MNKGYGFRNKLRISKLTLRIVHTRILTDIINYVTEIVNVKLISKLMHCVARQLQTSIKAHVL
jgi:hypothetical protein